MKFLNKLFYLLLAHVESVKFLLKHGAKRELRDKDGKTALDKAKSVSNKTPARQRVIAFLQMCYQIRNRNTIEKPHDVIASPIGSLFS